MLRTLGQFFFKKYNASAGAFDMDNETMASGSANMVITGTGKNSVWGGMGQIASVTGGQVMMNVADDYAGLGDYNETGIGSVFRVLGAIFFIGAGKLYFNGTYATASASTTLQIKKVTSGTLGTTYQAGSARSSAPTISAVTPPTGFTGKNNGVVSVQITRIRSATGGESNASLTSNAVTATNQSIAVTFPSADANGQDYWGVYVTKNGDGAVGNHYFLQEIPESAVTDSITVSRVATNSTSIGVANGTLTSSNIGWQYTSSGDTTTYVTAVGANDSYAAGKQTITLNAANGSTNTQNCTFTQAVTGATRTYVFEWRDTDLVGSDLAPVRNYPPPAAIFGGASGDVVFVDGALGDTVDVTRYARDNSISSANTTTTTVGNAIAISDPSRPESFPPDNYVFTGDAPTAILRGSDGLHWRFSRNSLGVIRYVGSDGQSPALTYERVWSGVGIQNQNHCCLGAGGRLYAYTGQRGLVRLGVNGEPDTMWATPIHDDITANGVTVTGLVYDANQQYIIVITGSTLFCFYEPLEVWCAPLNLISWLGFGNAANCGITYHGNAYITVNDLVSSFDIFNFGSNPGAAVGTVVTPFVRSGGVSDVISRVYAAVRADASDSLSIKTENQSASITQTVTAANIPSRLSIVKPNLRNSQYWRMTLTLTPSSTGSRCGFDHLRVDGLTSDIVA